MQTTTALSRIASRILSGIVVGIALGCLYSAYDPPTAIWASGGLLYGLLTGIAWVTADRSARMSLRYLLFDVFIAGIIVAIMSLALPKTVLGVLSVSFFMQGFWQMLNIAVIIVCLVVLAVAWLRESSSDSLAARPQAEDDTDLGPETDEDAPSANEG